MPRPNRLALQNAIFDLSKNCIAKTNYIKLLVGARQIIFICSSVIYHGQTYAGAKYGSDDPDPLLRKGGSKDQDPDPLLPNVEIRIHVKIRWIRIADTKNQFDNIY